MVSYVKTILLLGILSVILITIGGLIGGKQGLYYALFFALFMNGVVYFFSDKIALSVSGAKPLNKQRAPELYEAIENLSRKMSLPMPKIYITPEAQANAFATGRDPNHASVAVTEGLLRLLPTEEVKAVLAHELSHVKNRDILIASIAAVIASAISMVANMGLYGGRMSDDEDNRAGGILSLIALIVVPIAAFFIQMAISREREFGADESGARLIGSGKPLAKALITINESAKRAPMNTSPAFASLYIGNPLGKLGGGMRNLFSTHPSLEERLKRLEKI